MYATADICRCVPTGIHGYGINFAQLALTFFSAEENIGNDFFPDLWSVAAFKFRTYMLQ